MKTLITGSSGMVGSLVLNACLASHNITEVISFVRKASNKKHPKLNEIIVNNFEDYTEYSHHFHNITAAFFCIGVYTGQVADNIFKRITVNYATSFGKTLSENSPKARLCLLSGAGADPTEKSRTSFARYKGMAENQLKQLDLEFYSLRPAYIYPSIPREEPNMMYRVSKWLYPLIKCLGNKYSITSQQLAYAMFKIGTEGTQKSILENDDLLAIS